MARDREGIEKPVSPPSNVSSVAKLSVQPRVLETVAMAAKIERSSLFDVKPAVLLEMPMKRRYIRIGREAPSVNAGRIRWRW